jgi:hypothetical protein
MLGLVFTIALGGGWLLGQLPRAWSRKIAPRVRPRHPRLHRLEARPRLGTIIELFVLLRRTRATGT